MTVQTQHAGAIGHAPTATTPTAADLERTRAAARAALSQPVTPENVEAARAALAVHWHAYADAHRRPWLAEMWPVLLTLAMVVGALALLWWAGGWYATWLTTGGASLLALALWLVRRIAGDD